MLNINTLYQINKSCEHELIGCVHTSIIVLIVSSRHVICHLADAFIQRDLR